jgi:hypothetical protein
MEQPSLVESPVAPGQPKDCLGDTRTGGQQEQRASGAKDSALAEIERNAGSQFDPGVVRAFLAAWADDELDRFLPDHRLSA